MTLQEKIDKLPKQIEYNGNIYTMRYGGNLEYVFIEYETEECEMFKPIEQ